MPNDVNDNSRNSSESIKPYEPDNRQLLLVISQMKEHVVQIEAMVAYLFVCVVALDILDTAVANTRYNFLLWLVPGLFLIGLRSVVRVTNPESRIRDGIKDASTYGGILVVPVVAITEIVSNGAAATVGDASLIAFVVGAVIGVLLKLRTRDDELLQRGEAFDFLYKYRNRIPELANPTLIEEVLDNNKKI